MARFPLLSGRQPSTQHDGKQSYNSSLIRYLKVPFCNSEMGEEGEINEWIKKIQQIVERAKTFAIRFSGNCYSSEPKSPLNGLK